MHDAFSWKQACKEAMDRYLRECAAGPQLPLYIVDKPLYDMILNHVMSEMNGNERLERDPEQPEGHE